MRSRQFAARVGFAALVLLISGCSSVAPTGSASSASPDVFSSSSPEADVSSAPLQVFGGSCSALFSEAEVSGAVSTPVTLRAAVGAYLGDLVEAAAGGIQCSWSSENGAVWVDVDALPADVLTIAVDHGCGPGGELDGPICGIDATSDGIRLAGAVLVAEGDSAPALAAVQNLEEIFATRASGNGAPAPQRPSSAWGHLADCDSLVGAAAAQAGMASDVLIGETPTYDAYFVPVYLELRGGRLGCGAISVDTDASTDFAVIGGAQWAEALVAAREGTQLVAVPGLDTVYLGAEQSTGYRYIDVFDGVNWLEAFTTNPEWSYPLLAAVVAELNDRL